MQIEIDTILQIFFYAAIASVVIVWIYGFTLLARGKISASSTSKYLLLLGSGITLVCAILWLGDILSENIAIEDNAATAIWGTLISGILATSLAVYKQQFSGVKASLKIENLLLLDEHRAFPDGNEDLKKLFQRNNANYKRGEEKVLFCAIISGFQEKAGGTIDLQIETLVFDNNNLAASLLPKGHSSDPDRWKTKSYADSVKNIIGDVDKMPSDFTLVIGMIEDIPNFINNGLIELQVTVIDNLSHLVSRRSKEIVVN